MQDKFRLDLTDEEAVHYMQSVIDVSVSATVAALMEQMHKIAQVRMQIYVTVIEFFLRCILVFIFFC